MRQTLEALLRHHQPAGPREAGFRLRMLELLRDVEDPFARNHYAPGHFTASAFILSPPGDAVLLIHHQKLQRWLQPGGHVDVTDNDIVAAARREVLEETGLAQLRPHPQAPGIFDIDIHLIPARKDEPAHEHFDVRVLLRAERTDATAGSDADAARWVPLGEVSEAESDASVMRAVKKLQAM